MIRLFLFILSLLLSFSVLSQETGLLKAEIKAKSKHNKISKSKGFELVGISARFGKGMENTTKVEESVTNIEYSGDTLLVEVSLVANCCASFVAELEITNDKTLNIVFEKNDINCLCLKGIYLTSNAETEEIEFWGNGNMKSIKMYLGTKLKTEHLYDESGKRTKTLNYEGLKVTEKTY